jgi:hypothetical protein
MPHDEDTVIQEEGEFRSHIIWIERWMKLRENFTKESYEVY